MEINILAFGQITDITGKSEWKVSGISNTDDLRKELKGQFPDLFLVNFTMAVNKNIVLSNVELQNNDIVALLPPFSGG